VPAQVDYLWCEGSYNNADCLRVSGPNEVVKGGRLSGTVTATGRSAAVNLLPGSSGAEITGINWGATSGTGYYSPVIDSSVTNYWLLGKLSNGTGTEQMAAGTSASPSLTFGNCGLYTSGATILPTTGCSFGSAGNPAAAPAWLQYLGTAASGAYTCTSGTCTKGSGVYNYTTFNVSSGATLNLTGGTVVVYATGACTINGAITSAITSAQPAYYAGGGSGGGGGGGTAAGSAASNVSLLPGITPTSSVALAGGGTAGAASGGTGGNGNTTSATSSGWLALLNSGTLSGYYWTGSPGGAGGSSGGAGGYQGAGLILMCQSITGTGTINTSGSAGGNAAANNQGAGGGGGAGPLVLSSQATEALTGMTLTANGGAGGSCLSYTGCGAGGTGGSAPVVTFSGW